MSKELEALEEIKTLRGFNQVELNNDKNINKSLDVIEQALLKTQEQEKALKVIFEKMVNILLLELAENVDEYNERIVRNGQLTEEEFNLLKRHF